MGCKPNNYIKLAALRLDLALHCLICCFTLGYNKLNNYITAPYVERYSGEVECMETSKFFLFINRLNSILFLLALLLVTGSILFLINETQNRPHKSLEIEAPAGDEIAKEKLKLSNVHYVSGHEIQYLFARSTKYGRLASGGYSYTDRNVLFLDRKGDKPVWLFESNDNVIISMRQLSVAIDEKERKAKYIYYVVASSDTNNDGSISDDDNVSISISQPDGSAFNKLVDNVSRVISYDYLSTGNVLALLIQVDRQVLYREYELESGVKKVEKVVIKL
ncbi:hypothetical protein C8D97_109141 [Pleionea mediterranea]|uniref:Uncharacterized protein n=2 Tax=Pleionea mediterranea TaxID=523701 RepID=A0A316FLI6_9GAMM|nr:hypothetical protein C8D97_109141 [Pleionea mediterranea]